MESGDFYLYRYRAGYMHLLLKSCCTYRTSEKGHTEASYLSFAERGSVVPGRLELHEYTLPPQELFLHVIYPKRGFK